MLALARLQEEVWSRFGVEVVPLKRVLPADLRSPGKRLGRYTRKAEKRARDLGYESAGDRYAKDPLYRREMDMMHRAPHMLRGERALPAPPEGFARPEDFARPTANPVKGALKIFLAGHVLGHLVRPADGIVLGGTGADENYVVVVPTKAVITLVVIVLTFFIAARMLREAGIGKAVARLASGVASTLMAAARAINPAATGAGVCAPGMERPPWLPAEAPPQTPALQPPQQQPPVLPAAPVRVARRTAAAQRVGAGAPGYAIGTRTVGVQSQVTYVRRNAKPHFYADVQGFHRGGEVHVMDAAVWPLWAEAALERWHQPRRE